MGNLVVVTIEILPLPMAFAKADQPACPTCGVITKHIKA